MRTLILFTTLLFSLGSWAAPKPSDCGRNLTPIEARLDSALTRLQELRANVNSQLKLSQFLPDLVPPYAVQELKTVAERINDLETAIGLMRNRATVGDVTNLEASILALDGRVIPLTRVSAPDRERPHGHRAREIERNWPGDLDWMN